MATVNLLAWAFDGLLVAGLLWLAWQALNSTELFRAIVLFIAFGLLMALAWVRLDAPDIALAEAAIGAGLTGALLLAALARLEGTAVSDETSSPVRWLALAAVLPVALGLGYVVWSLPLEAPGLTGEVAAHLSASGVSNPVTAVLLNFRGYDTLLEMMVLLLALLGVWALDVRPPPADVAPGSMLDSLARLLIPLLLLVAAYLLWVGAHAPGGAFQAGAVLAAAGVLLLLAGWRPRAPFSGPWLRLLLLLGPAGFVLMALLSLLLRGQMLSFPADHAGVLILLLETAASLSIGVTLAALFLGTRPDDGEEGP